MGGLEQLETDYLVASSIHQDRCADASRDGLSSDLERHTSALSELLLLLDLFACCSWGCHGKEHIVEYLVGRAVSNARAAWRLIEFGHYDEALALTRGICEIGNLLWLFFVEPAELRRWLDSSDLERKKRYQPAAVRKAIEAAGGIVPHPQAEYSRLCEVAVHPTPKTMPQAQNAHKVPTLGGYYQERGQQSCIIQLCWAVGSVAGPAAKIALLNPKRAEEIVKSTVKLVESLPEETDQGVTTTCDEILKQTLHLDKTIRG